MSATPIPAPVLEALNFYRYGYGESRSQERKAQFYAQAFVKVEAALESIKAPTPSEIPDSSPPARVIWVSFHDNGNPKDVFPEPSGLVNLVQFREIPGPGSSPGGEG